MNIIVMALGLVIGAFLGYLFHAEKPRSAFSFTAGASITVLIAWLLIEHPFGWMVFDREINTSWEILRTIVIFMLLITAYGYLVIVCFNHGVELSYSPKVRQIAQRTGKSADQIAEEMAEKKRRQAAQKEYNSNLAAACRISGIGVEIIDLDEDPDGLERDVLAVPKIDPTEEKALMARAKAKAIQKMAEAASALASESQETTDATLEDAVEPEQPSAEAIASVREALLADVDAERLEEAKEAVDQADLAFLARPDVFAKAKVLFPKQGRAYVHIFSAVLGGAKNVAM